MEVADRRLLTVKQVAAALAVSERTVIRLINPSEYGVLSAVHVGRSVRVKAEDLDAYIDSLDAAGVA